MMAITTEIGVKKVQHPLRIKISNLVTWEMQTSDSDTFLTDN